MLNEINIHFWLFAGVQASIYGCVKPDQKQTYTAQFNIDVTNACFFYCLKNEFPYAGLSSKVNTIGHDYIQRWTLVP